MEANYNILDAPCVFCGYNGKGYWQVGTHSKKCPFNALGGMEERRGAFRDILVSKEAQAKISFEAGKEEERAKWIIETKSGSSKAFLSLPIEERRTILAKQARDLADSMADSQAKEDLKIMD